MASSEIGSTPPDVTGTSTFLVTANRLDERFAVEFVVRSNGRRDLKHPGRPSEQAMQARLDAFLAKQPDLEQRQIAQIVREFKMRGYR